MHPQWRWKTSRSWGNRKCNLRKLECTHWLFTILNVVLMKAELDVTYFSYAPSISTQNYKLIQCQNKTMHFSPVVWLCLVLPLRYDFVGHQETLQEDAEHLLKILHLEHIQFPPHYKNMTTTSFVSDWFRTVPLEDRRKLYKIYEKDFKLFGYPKPVELLDD